MNKFVCVPLKEGARKRERERDTSRARRCRECSLFNERKMTGEGDMKGRREGGGKKKKKTKNKKE